MKAHRKRRLSRKYVVSRIRPFFRAYSHPPLNIHLLLGRKDRSDWRTIHRYHALETWRRYEDRTSKALLLFSTCVWPFYAVLLAFRLTGKYGRDVKAQIGKRLTVQLMEQIYLICGQSLSPKAYYFFQLYHSENRKRSARYIHRYETKGRARVFRDIAPDQTCSHDVLHHKDQFFQRCVQYGLETTPVHLVIDAADDRHDRRLPFIDLFIKPTVGRGGRGAQIWRHQGEDRYQGTDGETLDASVLIERLRRSATTSPWLVQSCIGNHPSLLSLCGSVFSTARVMTVLDEEMQPEVTTAVFRMASSSDVVDNIHRGGVAAAIDLESGRLGSALSLNPTDPQQNVHPRTKVKIRDHCLPDWEAAKHLAVRAHIAMSGYAVVGWDIGFAPTGPILVEGNFAPCVHLLQRGMGAPLGGTRFTELIAFHLRHVAHTS